MKHIKAILYATLLCAALALAGCSDILAPPDGARDGAKGKKGGLQINVSSDTANPRTLFPKTNFTKYVFSFTGPANHAGITLTGGQTTTTVNDLAAGSWTVTAVGYVMINGTEYAAVQGSSQVNITSGMFQSLDIVLSASMAGANGFFSYSVSFPPSKVNNAELKIYPYGYSEWDGGVVQQYNLADDPSKTISLAPGYYMMNIRLSNDYQTAGHTEVVYICSKMETAANYVFTDADFTETITLSGTIDVKVNGQNPSGNVNVNLYAYLDENYNNHLANIWVNLSDNTWTMTTAAFDAETPLYFRVETYYNNLWLNRNLGEGVRAYNQNISGINLGVNFSTITLSGTIDVKVNGQTPSGNVNVYLNAYLDENYNNYLAQIWVNLSDSTWSITRAAFDAETPLYFRVETYYNGLRFDRYLGESVKAYNQNISGINLGPVNFSTITLSGTIDVKVNGQTPSGDVYLYAYNYNNFLDSVQVNLSDNTWTMTTAAFDAETPLYFRVEHRGLGFSEDLGEGVRAYNQNISGINLGTVQIITESVTTINYGTPKLYNTVDKTDANYVDPLWDVLGWMPVARCNSADSDYEFIYNPTTSGKAKLYWDVDGLWLYVDVITNNISTDAGYEHSGSSVELLINERVDVGEPVGTTGGDAFANGGYYRLDSNGDISGDPIAAIEAFRLHNKYKTWRTTTGYAVIFQAPWRAMGAYPLHDGKKIGLEIQINAANDYKTGRVGVLKWYNTVKNTYQNSTVLAPVTLNLNGLTLPAQKPVITAQPVGSKVALNDPVPALTVTAASLDGGALSYRWYQATSATAFEGATAVGTNSPSYTPNVSNAVVGEHFFYVKVTNTTTEGSSALNSAMARVRVCDPAVTPFDIELVKPDHEKWDATVNALVIDNNGVSFGSYSTIVEVDIPATINMTNYIMLEFDLDTYVAGTIVPIPPNSQWYNNIGFTVLDGSGFVVYHEYYGGPGYSWNFNANYGRSAIKTADYSGGQGKVMITVPNRTDAVDKVVVRSVKFIVEE